MCESKRDSTRKTIALVFCRNRWLQTPVDPPAPAPRFWRMSSPTIPHWRRHTSSARYWCLNKLIYDPRLNSPLRTSTREPSIQPTRTTFRLLDIVLSARRAVFRGRRWYNGEIFSIVFGTVIIAFMAFNSLGLTGLPI